MVTSKYCKFGYASMCGNIFKAADIYTVKIARVSVIYILLIANSGNYLHLSIVVHYKPVHNNNALSVNYSFNSND